MSDGTDKILKTFKFTINNASENSLHKIYKLINNQPISLDVNIKGTLFTVKTKWVLGNNLQEYITTTPYFTLRVMEEYIKTLGKDLSTLLSKTKITYSVKEEQEEEEPEQQEQQGQEGRQEQEEKEEEESDKVPERTPEPTRTSKPNPKAEPARTPKSVKTSKPVPNSESVKELRNTKRTSETPETPSKRKELENSVEYKKYLKYLNK
jgi:hypothetical protein